MTCYQSHTTAFIGMRSASGTAALPGNWLR